MSAEVYYKVVDEDDDGIDQATQIAHDKLLPYLCTGELDNEGCDCNGCNLIGRLTTLLGRSALEHLGNRFALLGAAKEIKEEEIRLARNLEQKGKSDEESGAVPQ